MKRKVAWTLGLGVVFIFGIAVGAVVTYRLFVTPAYNASIDYYISYTREQVRIATRLREAHQGKLARHFDTQFPGAVRQLNYAHKDHPRDWQGSVCNKVLLPDILPAASAGCSEHFKQCACTCCCRAYRPQLAH